MGIGRSVTAAGALRVAVVVGILLTLAPGAAPAHVLAGPTVSSAATPTITRTAGPDRIATSVELARLAWPTGSDTVVLARFDRYGDALVGGPLAGDLDAPLLLTEPDRLSTATRAEVERLGATTAVLLGDESALAPAIEDDLRDAGIGTIDRLDGASPSATARLVAERLGATTAYVVEGANADPARGWPDAVSVSALAARNGVPILLVERDRVPDETRNALLDLRIGDVAIVGGTGAVSSTVATHLADPDGDGDDEVTVGRIAGADRYATSVQMASRTGTPAEVWLATGRGWPDALAAGPAAAQAGAVLLLGDGRQMLGSLASWDWLDAHASAIRTMRLVGGEAVVAPWVRTGIQQLFETGDPPRAGIFDAERATDFARRLADEIGRRPGGSAAEARARDRFGAALGAVGWTVTEEPFALPQGGTSANVVAWIGDERPVGGHVVIGGHIDTVADSPGANDNASGIGTLVALAEELADEPGPVPVVLVAFGAEEYQPSSPRQHHIGSEAYARAHADDVIAMISIDMVGHGSPTCLCWYENGPRLLADRLLAVARAEGKEDGYYQRARGDISDHGPFARRGVPALFLYTGTSPGYHGPGDTSDLLRVTDIRRAGVLPLAFVRGLTSADLTGLRAEP